MSTVCDSIHLILSIYEEKFIWGTIADGICVERADWPREKLLVSHNYRY